MKTLLAIRRTLILTFIASLAPACDNRESDQESEQNHRPACKAFQDQTQVCAAARDSAANSASDKIA